MQTEDIEVNGLATETNSFLKPQAKKGLAKIFQGHDNFLQGGTHVDTTMSQHEVTKQIQSELEKSGVKKQNTLFGVFFPVMQNILGVLLFIRVPKITGEAGIFHCCIIVTISCCTTFLTALSISAIATNGKIKQGGSYYMLSRSLGAPIGVAVGFLFYLGNAFGGAMYVLGAVEAFITATGLTTGEAQADTRVFGLILVIILLTINRISLKMVAQTGIVFLFIVLLGITSMYLGLFTAHEYDLYAATGTTGITGLSGENFENNWGSAYTDGSFFLYLSIYFPSVTGIFAGSNRSGDLADPSNSIPKGTIGAQLTTTFIYLSFPILFGGVSDRVTLQDLSVLFAAEASWPTKYLVQVAIIFSSAGAGMQSLASAPRLLEAIAKDKVLPIFNGVQEVSKCIYVTGILSICAIMIGSIDDITPIITMFFLLCYTLVNICTFYLDILRFPNWRPTFRYYHKFLSFLGFCLTIFLMIMINWWAFLIALAFAAFLFMFVQCNKTDTSSYGDSIEALKLMQGRSSLLGLVHASRHVKNWIPIVMIMGDIKACTEQEKEQIIKEKTDAKQQALRQKHLRQKLPEPTQEQLDQCIHQLTPQDQYRIASGNGCMNFIRSIRNDICITIFGDLELSTFDKTDFHVQREIKTWFDDFCNINHFQMMRKVIQTTNFTQGMQFLVQGAGLGGMEPNCLFLGYPEVEKYKQENAAYFMETIRFGLKAEKCIFVLKHKTGADKPTFLFERSKRFNMTIDIYSLSYERGLMFMMSFFMKRSQTWGQCQVRLFIILVSNNLTDEEKKEAEKKKNKDEINEFLKRYRLFQQHIQIEIIFIQPECLDHFIPAAKKDDFYNHYSLYGGPSYDYIDDDQENHQEPISKNYKQSEIKTETVENNKREYDSKLKEQESQLKEQESKAKEQKEQENTQNGQEQEEELAFDLNNPVDEDEKPEQKTKQVGFQVSEKEKQDNPEEKIDIPQGKETLQKKPSVGFNLPNEVENKDKQTLNPNIKKGKKKAQRALSEWSQSQITELNETIQTKSKNSDLVMMNLPDPSDHIMPLEYMQYIKQLTKGLQRVILIKNEHQDVITEFT